MEALQAALAFRGEQAEHGRPRSADAQGPCDRSEGYELLQMTPLVAESLSDSPLSCDSPVLERAHPQERSSRLRTAGVATAVSGVLMLCSAALLGLGKSRPMAFGRSFLQQAFLEDGCTPIGRNCTLSACCLDKAFKCYYKDPGWAECKMSCVPGVHADEAKHLQSPWSCVVASKDHPPPWITTTKAPPPPKPADLKPPAPATTAKPAPPAPPPTTLQSAGGKSNVIDIPPPPTTTRATTMPLGPTTLATTTTVGPTTVPGPHPTLLCISLMLPFGMEVSLIKSQLAAGVGIFACNSWKVYSNESIELSPGPPTRLTSEVFPGSLACPISHKYALPAALNSEIFYRFWGKVFQDPAPQAHDWTVKLDPDAVILPDRVRDHLRSRNPVVSQYINNCDQGLHGPIEAISKAGMQMFQNNLQRCHDVLFSVWMTFGEDVWLRKCFKIIGVVASDDYSILYERACKPYKWPMPCVTGAASFHPLKKPEDYFACLNQAKR